MTVGEPQRIGLDYTRSLHLEYLDSDPLRWGKRAGQARAAMLDHTCTCLDCTPAFAMLGDRQGEGHYGRRFFTQEEGVQKAPSEHAMLDIFAEIRSDGLPVRGAVEVITGDPGTVWLFRGIGEVDGEINGGDRHTCYSCAVAEFKAGRIGHGYTMVFELVKLDDPDPIEVTAFGAASKGKHGRSQKRIREALGLPEQGEDQELRMVSREIRPCLTKVLLPKVTIHQMPNARALMEERWQYDTKRVQEQAEDDG